LTKNLNEEAYELLQKDSSIETSLQTLYEFSGELNIPPKEEEEEDTKDINSMNHNGGTLSHFAALKGELELEEFLFVHPEANIGLKSTRCVCYVQDQEEIVVQSGSTPLDIIQKFQGISFEDQLLKAAKKDYIKIIKLLIENGANLNIVDYYGCDPVFLRRSNLKGFLTRFLGD
jgi:ankyrin repeat protein